MKILYFSADHAGFELKNELIKYGSSLGYTTIDFGANEYNENDDYPQYMRLVAQKIADESNNTRDTIFGIILGGTGTGEAIVANKYTGVRACVWYGGDLSIIKLAREHNNANVLSLGARFISTGEAKQALGLFVETHFSEAERHARRIAQIQKIEAEISHTPLSSS